MGIINVLDFQVANLIAAGEVVERPASAVKELLENALDAGATEITVEIKRGGSTFIRVSDNGCGMAREDMPIAIRRHATSKIATERDLDGITTLGFRGEALAAISSVSTMRIMSRRKEDAVGTVLTAEGGLVVDVSDAGCKVGTTVIVEELFANVPARRKFLKKDSSEAMAVASMVEKLALSRPDIAFKFISDGALKLQTRGDGKVAGTIYAVMGREFTSKLIEVNALTDGIEVRGYIGTPINVRSNRNFQNFFLNNRYIKSKTATAALEQAFDSYMETEKFPCCVLHIYIHPSFVDVNVHPTKMEVKFSNERLVFDAVYCAVRNALEEATERPEIKFEPHHMTPDQHSIYNAFVPVYDRISDTEEKALTQKQIFDDTPEPISQAEGVPQDVPVFAPPPTDADAPPVSARNTPLFDLGELAVTPLDLPDLPVTVPAAVKPAVSAAPRAVSADLPAQEPFSPPPKADTVPAEIPDENGYNPLFADLQFEDVIITHEPQTETVAPAPAVVEPSVGVTKTESETVSTPTAPALLDETPVQKDARSLPETDAGVKTEVPSSPAPTLTELFGNMSEPGSFLFNLSTGAQRKSATEEKPYRILGTAFHAYVFVESEDSVLLIDKHAAHERILFEDMKRIMAEQAGTLQLLILPLELPLSKEEIAAAIDYREEIAAAGFAFEISEDHSILYCTQIPSLLTSDRAADLLVAMIGALANGTGSVDVTRKTYFEEALYQASCKAAIKAGRIDREEDIAWVVARLFENPDILYCPHGRPVALVLKKSRIEHYFKRT
ncbi:MAG: DNA mismatch repair endonuclease MutL [Clostridia bacterium]|nr:DNA mismatch repair endonuclease MutL [Clostridia bacterium]